MISWFMPLFKDLAASLAPVAFLIWGVTYAWDFITLAARGHNRRL